MPAACAAPTAAHLDRWTAEHREVNALAAPSASGRAPAALGLGGSPAFARRVSTSQRSSSRISPPRRNHQCPASARDHRRARTSWRRRRPAAPGAASAALREVPGALAFALTSSAGSSGRHRGSSQASPRRGFDRLQPFAVNANVDVLDERHNRLLSYGGMSRQSVCIGARAGGAGCDERVPTTRFARGPSSRRPRRRRRMSASRSAASTRPRPSIRRRPRARNSGRRARARDKINDAGDRLGEGAKDLVTASTTPPPRPSTTSRTTAANSAACLVLKILEQAPWARRARNNLAMNEHVLARMHPQVGARTIGEDVLIHVQVVPGSPSPRRCSRS